MAKETSSKPPGPENEMDVRIKHVNHTKGSFVIFKGFIVKNRNSPEKINKEITCLGKMDSCRVGYTVSLSGRPIFSDRYAAWQFEFTKAVVAEESVRHGAAELLASEADYIGKSTAKHLVAYFGAEVIEKLAKEFQEDGADSVYNRHPVFRRHHVTREHAKQLMEWSVKNLKTTELKKHLYNLDIPKGIVNRIFVEHGEEAVKLLQERPFELTKYPGIGFETASKLAAKMGVQATDPLRIRAGVLHYLQAVMQQKGNTGLPKGVIAATCAKELEVAENVVFGAIEELLSTGKIVSSRIISSPPRDDRDLFCFIHGKLWPKKEVEAF